MKNCYEQFMDRETTHHLHSEHSKGKFYGAIIKINTGSAASKVQKDLQGLLGSLRVNRLDNAIFFSGPISDDLVKNISKYLSLQGGGILERKLIKGEYEDFVGNPKHWLKKYLPREN